MRRSLLPVLTVFLATSVASAEPPHLVVFISDDHGQRDSTPYGATDVRTPNLQKLADAGLTFTHAFVASPSCAPSRAAMLTGRMPARNGAEANHTYKKDDVASLPDVLRKLGYETAAFGKVAHGPTDGKRHGFDHLDKRHDVKAVAGLITKRDPKKPLFLFVGTPRPHVPWSERDGYDPAKVTLPPTFVDTPLTREFRARYYTDVTKADAQLGEIRDLVHKTFAQNAVLVYTSDHGGQWPFAKWNLYDAGLRVPLLVEWPGVVKPGTKTAATVQSIDLLPTLIELAGGAVPKDIDGRSYANVLRGKTNLHRRRIFATHSGDGDMNVYPIRAVRTRNYKFIRNLHPEYQHTTHIDKGPVADRDGVPYWRSWEAAAKSDAKAAAIVKRYHQRPAEELYDLVADPHETNNLAADPMRAKLVGALSAELEAWRKEQGDTGKVFGKPRLLGADKPTRPNVLLILADDLGWSDLGCYGSEIATPTLDRLAANGLRFTQFYNCTRCCPTRASLLTGLHPHQAGVGGMNNDARVPGYRGMPQPNTVTLAEVLRSAGYHTSMVGKWHLSVQGKPPHPTDRGFEEFYGMIGGFNSCFDEKPFYSRLPASRTKRTYAADGFYSTDAFADYSLDFLAEARKAKKPFFQYLAFNAPHFPLHARKEDVARYKDVYTKGWDKIRTERHARQIKLGLIDPKTPLSPLSEYKSRPDINRQGVNPPWETLPADRQADLARRMAVYAAMVHRMDHAIGRVVADLTKLGELDNTLILFLSDNGACAEWDPFGFDRNSGPDNVLHKGEQLDRMGGPGTYHSYGSGWANVGSTPFRLYKHYCHEGGISTPLIVHWPKGVTAKGELRRQVGHIVDVMATCVAVSGAEYPAKVGDRAITPMEGKSLLPAFANKPIERDYLAWEHERNRAVRVGAWKLVAKAGEPWSLYDVEADRVESNDLAGKMPDKVKELAAKWEEWAKRTNVVPYPWGKKKDKKG